VDCILDRHVRSVRNTVSRSVIQVQGSGSLPVCGSSHHDLDDIDYTLPDMTGERAEYSELSLGNLLHHLSIDSDDHHNSIARWQATAELGVQDLENVVRDHVHL
jgi:hypothetical protein